jgi:hypothetical protein
MPTKLYFSLLSESESTKTVSVSWTAGNRTGIADVTISADIWDEGEKIRGGAAVATTLRWIVFERELCGQKRSSGKGIEVYSDHQTTNFLTFPQYHGAGFKSAAFIPLRLRGITFIATNGTTEIQAQEQGQKEPHDEGRITIEVTGEIYEKIDTPALGEVWVTHHAVEQFVERAGAAFGEMREPWKSFVKQITNPGLVKYVMPEKVIQFKREKYGHDIHDTWGHPTSVLKFIVTHDNLGRQIVVTTVANVSTKKTGEQQNANTGTTADTTTGI